MRANTLRNRLKIQKREVVQDSYGEQGHVWRVDKTVWGSVRPLRGREYFANQQTQGSVTHNVEIRYTTLSDGTRITADCRFIDGSSSDGRIFNIVSPPMNIGERNRSLQFMCEEKVNG